MIFDGVNILWFLLRILTILFAYSNTASKNMLRTSSNKKFQLSIQAFGQRPKIFCWINYCFFCSTVLSSDRSSLLYDVLLQLRKILNFHPAQCCILVMTRAILTTHCSIHFRNIWSLKDIVENCVVRQTILCYIYWVSS